MKTYTSFLSLLPRLGLLMALGLCAAATHAQPTWTSVQRTSSTGGGGSSNGRNIAVAADGSQYVTGPFEGTLTLGSVTLTAGPGSGHLFLAKYSAAGTVLWATQFDSPADDNLFSNVAVDAVGNAYLTGYFTSALKLGATTLTTPSATTKDAFLIKFDGMGTQQWMRQGSGGSDAYATGIAVDASGNVVITGNFSAGVSFGAAGLIGGGMFLYRFSPAGTVLLAKQVSTGGVASDLTLDAVGNIYLTGGFTGTISFGPTTFTSAGGLDLYLCKLDAAGNPVWAQRDGDAADDSGQCVAVDPAGNAVVGGYYDDFYRGSSESSSIYVAGYDALGTKAWRQLITPTIDDLYTASDVVYDGRGGYYVTGGIQGSAVFGSTTLTTQGPQAAYVARYNSGGTAVWADQVVSVTSADGSRGAGLAVDASGSVYVTGLTVGDIQFGTLPVSSGAFDTFVAKLTPGGLLSSTRSKAPLVVLEAYPNPATGSTSLVLPAGGGHLVLADALGRIVREHTLPTAAGPYALALAGLAPGLYQLRAILGNGKVGRAAIQVR
ncbi:hypothetical protein [Hymenobacter terrenus]|uniref:hypothetical protein n=1 Tax=Hymenobacter terrenus TaxID=1629124 RepID=UPI000619E38A|nr:hypothetical protein [Hymenobacter terrenus]